MPLEQQELDWNADHIAQFHANGGAIVSGRLAGANILLMTTIGARTGLPRLAPMGYTRDGDRYVIVDSNSGGPTDSAWLANVRANPIVTVEVGTERFQARATITSGAERRRLLDAHQAAIPIFKRYEEMTDREIPVLTLERIS